MDLHHHVHSLALGGALHQAPLKKGIERILDLGTGTGAWAIDAADMFPEAIVIDTDLSPIQPSWVPPNCLVEIDDFELDWNFSQCFDYIHARSFGCSVNDFPRLFKQEYVNLHPGGCFEIHEFTIGVFSDDESEKRSTGICEWRDHLLEGSQKFGKQMGMAPKYKEMTVDAGFENVEQISLRDGLWRRSSSSFARVRKDLLDRSLHIYARFYVVYGQKEETEA
ncbi:S-adenosyl-L-methionine-dependent methyltransferase [Aspergillus ambiguus]|uniref:S-adenosyl-L-methionine-dependent methyltransferase n=1 Tax=Aspergillus ambiguus TaxID=176160 RepID=UPI003CCDC6FD